MALLLIEKLPDDIPFYNDELSHIINAVFYKILFHKYRNEIMGASLGAEPGARYSLNLNIIGSTPFTTINDIELQQQGDGSYLVILDTFPNTDVEPTIGIFVIWQAFAIINNMLIQKQKAHKEKISQYSKILSDNIYSFSMESKHPEVRNPLGLDESDLKDSIKIIIKRTPMDGLENKDDRIVKIKWERLKNFSGSYWSRNHLLNGLNDVYTYFDFTLIFFYFENFWKIFGIIPKEVVDGVEETDVEYNARILQEYYKVPENSGIWRIDSEEKLERGDLSTKSSKDIFYIKYLIDFLLKSARGNLNGPG